MIGDILDISRIESGHLSLAPERANLREMVLSVCRVFEGLARQKRLLWHIDVDAQSDVDVLIDPTRFKQVLSNLLSNAIKFTEEGEVRLQLGLAASDAERLAMRVIIEDSGIGISAEDRQQLFNPFVQAGNPSDARSGSGLGLVISRSLCEMMGGTVRLDSEPGRGTRVEVRLDLALLEPLAPRPIGPETPAAPARSLNILVVDDHPVNRLLLCWQLSELGHRTVDTADGELGLERWRTQPFDVLITDCNMPRRNGYELARAIREEEARSGRVPCLVLGFTANAQAEERLRCFDAGMDDCLFKPIRLSDLEQALKSFSQVDDQDEPTVEIELPEIDLTALEQMSGNDRAVMDRLRNEVLNSLNHDLRRLDDFIHTPDRSGLRDLAHHIKGGAQMVGAARLVSACVDLERACQATEAVAVDSAISALREVMQQLAQRLQV